MRCNYIHIILILAVLALGAGCTRIHGNDEAASAANFDGAVKLAVMPFHSAPDVKDSGRIVSDILANQLYALGKYNIVAPEVIEKGLADQEGETLSTAKAGELAGAPYIVTGSVSEYTYKAGVGETPVVGVTVRLIQAANGAVLWSATRTATGGGNWFQEDSLSQLTVMICKSIADHLDIFLQKYLADGTGISRLEIPAASGNSGTR